MMGQEDICHYNMRLKEVGGEKSLSIPTGDLGSKKKRTEKRSSQAKASG